MQTQTQTQRLVFLAVLVVLGAVWLWVVRRRKLGLASTAAAVMPAPLEKHKDMENSMTCAAPGPLRTHDVLQHALFPGNAPATWSTGMQWHHSWRADDNADGLCCVFDAEFDEGLMLGVSRGMSDTAGGVIVHLLAPDRERDDMLLYGLSDMLHPSQIRATAMVKRENAGGFKRRTYWFRHSSTMCTLGHGDTVGANVIFHAPLPHQQKAADSTKLRFFGFGTSVAGTAQRAISRVALCSK